LTGNPDRPKKESDLSQNPPQVGRPFNRFCQEAFPQFFFGRGRRPSQRERKGLESKTHGPPPPGSGIGIVNVSKHTLSNFSSHKSFVKNFSLADLGKNSWAQRLAEKFLKRKGLRDDEEKDAINR
jgi:hypothetical protein